MCPGSDNREPQISQICGLQRCPVSFCCLTEKKASQQKLRKTTIDLVEEQEETEGNGKGRKKREDVAQKIEKTLKAFWRSEVFAYPEKKKKKN